MTLHEAVQTVLTYASQGELSPAVLSEVLGGRPERVLVAGGQAEIVIAYPGWELALAEKEGQVVALIRSTEAPFAVVRVAEYSGEWHSAFARMVRTVLEAVGW